MKWGWLFLLLLRSRLWVLYLLSFLFSSHKWRISFPHCRWDILLPCSPQVRPWPMSYRASCFRFLPLTTRSWYINAESFLLTSFFHIKDIPVSSFFPLHSICKIFLLRPPHRAARIARLFLVPSSSRRGEILLSGRILKASTACLCSDPDYKLLNPPVESLRCGYIAVGAAEQEKKKEKSTKLQYKKRVPTARCSSHKVEIKK